MVGSRCPCLGGRRSYLLDYFAGEGASDPELVRHPMESGHPRHVDAVWPLWNLRAMTREGRGEGSPPIQNYEHSDYSLSVLGQ